MSNISDCLAKKRWKPFYRWLGFCIFLPIAVIAAFLLLGEWDFRSYVDMGGQRNHLTCEVRTADGSSMPKVTLIFSASDGYRYIPLSGLAGGQPDRTIEKTYQLTTAVPGSVTVEWPRLYLRLIDIRIGEYPVKINTGHSPQITCWDNFSRHYAPDGIKIAAKGGTYSATVVIDPNGRNATIIRPETK